MTPPGGRRRAAVVKYTQFSTPRWKPETTGKGSCPSCLLQSSGSNQGEEQEQPQEGTSANITPRAPPSTERHSLPKPRPPQHDPVQRSYRRGGAASSEEERPGSPRSGGTEQGQEKRRPWHPRQGGPTRRPAPVMPAEPLTAEAASSGRGTGAPLNQDTRHPER